MFQNNYSASSLIVVLLGLMQNSKITAADISSADCAVGGNATCTAPNSFCDKTVCKCKPGFKENPNDHTKCILVLGANCQTANECPPESNTECTGPQSTKCSCKPNFSNSSGICIANAINNNNNQNPASTTSTDCTSGGNTTCTAAKPNSICVTNMCKCKPGYNENPTDHTKCILVLGANCQTANDCPPESNTECTGPLSKKCGCKPSFSNSSGICIANAVNKNSNQKPDSAAVTTRFTVVSVGVATILFLFQLILY